MSSTPDHQNILKPQVYEKVPLKDNLGLRVGGVCTFGGIPEAEPGC